MFRDVVEPMMMVNSFRRRRALAIAATFTAVAIAGFLLTPTRFAGDLIFAGALTISAAILVTRARRAAEAANDLAAGLAAGEEKFRSMIQNAADGVVLVGADSTFTYASPAIEKILGVPIEELVGRIGLTMVHEADAERAGCILQEVLSAPGARVDEELRVNHADGSLRWIEFTATNLLHIPAVQGIVCNCRDITKRKALEDELKHQAFYDSLTGLANRALITDRAEHALLQADRTGSSVALIIFDLDDFKLVNDQHGHGIGDELLKELARRAQATLRASDTLGRLEGDEFAVLVQNLTSSHEAGRVAERLVRALESPFVLADKEMSVYASIGIAVAENGKATVENLFRDADLAMHEAKRKGKGAIAAFNPDLHSRTLERMSMRAELEGALERDEFEIFFQPQFDLATRELVGAEALLRWNHPRLGMVSPAHFIPIAEESGAIVKIGRWVLHEATRRAAEWKSRWGLPLTISVNVSARQFATTEFVDEVRLALASSGLPPKDLVLELTESLLLERDEDLIDVLDRLNDIGVVLAIDDFGTGYSSLGYLKDLPISVLKIDRAFVASVADGVEESAIAHAIIRLAQALNLTTLAEGIENEEQATALRYLGCASAQGFHFARPMPVQEIERLIADLTHSPSLSFVTDGKVSVG